MRAAARGGIGGRVLCRPGRRSPLRGGLSEAPRLASAVWVGALVRRVHAAGDFATVLRRGDDVAGSVVLVHRARSGARQALARAATDSGLYRWQVGASGDSVDDWVARQAKYDPDLWVIELDTPDLARFIDETIG